jgi:hypothetical protein
VQNLRLSRIVPWVFIGAFAIAAITLYAITGDIDRSIWVAALVVGIGAAVVAACYLVPVLSFGVHELGHLLLGWLVGFRFHEVAVHGFHLIRMSRGLQFKKLPESRSFAGMFPGTTKSLLWRYRFFVLGGPFASWLLLGAIALLYLATDRGPWPTVYMALAVWCASMPLRSSDDEPTADNYLLRRSFREPEEMRLAIIATAIMCPWQEGVRSREWRKEFIDAAIELSSAGTSRAWAHLVLYYYELDSGRYAEAWWAISSALLVECEPGFEDGRSLIVVEAAFAAAALKQDPQYALRILSHEGEKLTGYEIQVKRAQSAIAAQQGDCDLARQLNMEGRGMIEQKHEEPYQDNIFAELSFFDLALTPCTR